MIQTSRFRPRTVRTAEPTIVGPTQNIYSETTGWTHRVPVRDNGPVEVRKNLDARYYLLAWVVRGRVAGWIEADEIDTPMAWAGKPEILAALKNKYLFTTDKF